MNNPPVVPIDVLEGSFWYNKTDEKVRVFNVIRRWYNPENILTFELAELHEKGTRILEVFAKDFIENAKNGKMIYLKNLTELSNQLIKSNEPTNHTSSTTEN